MSKLLYRTVVLFTMLCFCFESRAQSDTLHLTLPETEKLFLDSNLTLLAAYFNVDANKALIEQAKLWDNPVLQTDQNIYADGKFFQHGKDAVTGQPTGQYFIQIQQLIKTAGKRGKLINMASTNARISELQLKDVLRNLRYQLRQDYYTLIQQLENRKISQEELQQMNSLLAAQQVQLKTGNIAEKDYLRLLSETIAIQQDLLELDKSIADIQNDLKTLTALKDNRFIYPSGEAITTSVAPVTADELFTTASQNNAGYLLQQAQVDYEKQNLSYQKALRSPDITLGPEYDHNSNYAPNYVGLSVSLPLPIFNNNKGNIKAASFSVKQQEAVTSNAETTLKNNISNAYQKLLMTQQQLNSDHGDFQNRLGDIFKNMVKSYQQRQVSLLEFIDFFNTYKDAKTRQLQQQLNLQLAREEVNYYAGTDILKNN